MKHDLETTHYGRLGGSLLVGTLMFGAVGAAQAQAPAVAPAPAAPDVKFPKPAPADTNPTPRDADGHPILAGIWTGAVPGAPEGILRGADFLDFRARGGSFLGFEEDGGLLYHDNPNQPLYKPEHWNTVQENDYWGNWRDPINFCVPAGVPRLLNPSQIIKIDGQPVLMFVYSGKFQTANVTKMVPTDGRPHNAVNVAAETYLGDATGKWEGDTLVVESTGFTDNTWLDKGGYIHGFKMKVTERLTRKGNTLIWEATVEDPEYLQEPWKMTPVVSWLNTSPTAYIAEALPCDSRIHEPWGNENKPSGASHTRSGPL